MINVSKLKKGIIIDHIEAGHGFEIYKELHLNDIDDVVVLLKNIPSKKMKQKDLIKIETDLQIDMTVLGLIDPNVTINFVKNGELYKKISLTLPTVVNGIMTCKNPRCITQYEDVKDIKFFLVNEEKKQYRCEYCDAYTTFIDEE
ncbi:aspartate carbamoyltransferase regulatory subunit [Acetobacterium wieringae]|jgi:aspartate carbamoyltransferase regulatory subunit|uniref:Aspartate carbamoyltransferase regulatory chain n=1 Tax=Acetobacterium wieringae TaxID=52694 RepID=A0A1F2PEL3_9FIRM|nr:MULTISPECIES: aspartate carbamoyltransferase regulatory subunit [Acetobacterium]HAZ06687.1 aspartate carbamoyltransferase regulatory subunit [Acetobacterium sp.]MEA4807175.1 aspartate carbamoyltransferase regulatory subunit [Acetobacterium wieringae]OFV69703.1 aspartate carbamoyltransferase regulatory chain [Acetobacterium wieringae]OXS27489.1 MAG: aspartate carbamoyltransferase regulatory subunit [Acetobacterium sp. MES1]TYC84841.1 aspartate carbamoyltransferase regulatory subunit [Acetoba